MLKARGLVTNLRHPARSGCRLLSSPSDDVPVEEFLDKHLGPSGKGSPPTGITTTRREVLSLYRDVWRATRAFNWPNEQGVLWSDLKDIMIDDFFASGKDVLRLSTRREFEAAQFERDPQTIAKLVVVGRDAVRVTLEKFAEKQQRLVTNSEADLRGRPPN